MKWKNTSKAWGGVTQLFHWGMLLILIAQYTVAYAMINLPEGSPQVPVLFTWHKQTGLTLFLLVFLRLWWRERNPVPADTKVSPPWDRLISKVNIFILYLIMFTLPFSGLLMSILGGHSVSYFGLFTISAVMEGPNFYAKTFNTGHIWLSLSLYIFVGFHILGALYHHFVLKDNVLLRILPQR